MPCTALSPTRARKSSATVSPDSSSSVYSKSSNTDMIAASTPAVASRPSNGRKATGLWNWTSGREGGGHRIVVAGLDGGAERMGHAGSLPPVCDCPAGG